MIATGSEVQLALAAHEVLKGEGTKSRVVSMPNWSLYERQSPEYREAVLPAEVTARIAIEAGAAFGWSNFLGLNGDARMLGMKSFGASGKPESLFSEFGLTVDSLLQAARSTLKTQRR